MRTREIDAWLGTLRRTFPVKRQVDTPEMRKAYLDHDTDAMLLAIKQQVGLNMKLRLALVNSGTAKGISPDAHVWTELLMPLGGIYGTPAFVTSALGTVYVRKEYLRTATYDQAVATISGCVTLLLLSCLNHELKDTPEAVELVAMMLGYSDSFIGSGPTTRPKRSTGTNPTMDMLDSLLDLVKGAKDSSRGNTLSAEERAYAAKKIATLRR